MQSERSRETLCGADIQWEKTQKRAQSEWETGKGKIV